jgi:hypothetical protein
MVLLLDDLAVFNAKCVEDIKCLAVREADLSRDLCPGSGRNRGEA